MKKAFFIVSLPLFLMLSCGPIKQTSQPPLSATTITLDTIEVSAETKRPAYRPSRTRLHDLLHTVLDVRFDWEKQEVLGKATLTLKPYFYPASSIALDAKGFEIFKVALQHKDSLSDLAFSYDQNTLLVELGTELTSEDTFRIYIEYTARPNELNRGGGIAITEDKGLYFINPLGTEAGKPRQIWTQGETESNSCWFPTIDSPNERMTQEVYITVDQKFETLSNGELVFRTENPDGTRTDYWQQDLPHAPYLVMMAIGEYAIVEDTWRDMDVWYYVEPEFRQYAMEIFGNTPEMLTFFSSRLGVDYPWAKYHQVVVRDFVSGAMENTSAVIHGSFIQRTHRELIDQTYEEYIAHELFHHWFGDLVTCESWANLPLNESFATYGEYLWTDHKYGTDEADHHLQQDLISYLAESRYKQEDMIRFGYRNVDDMFDNHSYAKGGRILHMLRKYMGDPAFFKSLEHYLNKHRFASTEIHDLRIAFEEVSGEDLNWFFNQWFLASGHPELYITYAYDDSAKQQLVMIEQMQDLKTTPLYKLPLQIDIYADGGKESHRIVLEEAKQSFAFDARTKPDLVNVDAEKMLLCKKNDKKDVSSWVFQFYHAPLYLDRYEAVEECGGYARKDSLAAKVVIDALDDPFWGIRSLAIRNLKHIVSLDETLIKDKLVNLVKHDSSAKVRANAIRKLARYFDDPGLITLYMEATRDSSYAVVGDGLKALAEKDPKSGMAMAAGLENETNGKIISTIAEIYAGEGTDAQNSFYLQAATRLYGLNKIDFIKSYEAFLLNNKKTATVNAGLTVFQQLIEDESAFFIKIYGIQGLKSIRDDYAKKEYDLNNQVSDLENTDPGAKELAPMKARLDEVKLQKQKITALLEALRAREKDEKLINVY